MLIIKPNVHRALLLVSLIGGMALLGCKKKDETKPTEAPAVKVTAEVVQPASGGTSVTYSGTVSASSSTPVSFLSGGTVTALNFKEGDRVHAGQVMGKVKSGNLDNGYNIAKAQLDEAMDAYNRLKILHDADALPEIKWVEIQQKVKQSRNAVEIASRAVSETTLTAPVSGIIERKLADVGQNVTPLEPIYQIMSTDGMTIDISVPENELAKYPVGREATITFDIEGVAPMQGSVVRKNVSANPLTRGYTVQLSLPSDADGKILQGMVGTVVFNEPVSDGSAPALAVPSQAVVLNDDNRLFVWIVKGGKAERRFVTTGPLTASGVTVTSGLQPGDSVITAGMRKVGTGSRVEIVKGL